MYKITVSSKWRVKETKSYNIIKICEWAQMKLTNNNTYKVHYAKFDQ